MTESFGMNELLATHGEGTIPLFAIDPRERILVFCAEQAVAAEAGWSVISLVRVEGNQS